jgi:hypothetical protein
VATSRDCNAGRKRLSAILRDTGHPWPRPPYQAYAAPALPLASPVCPTASWYDLCFGREQAPAPTAAVVGLVVQCPILCWASRAPPAPRLPPAPQTEREPSCSS